MAKDASSTSRLSDERLERFTARSGLTLEKKRKDDDAPIANDLAIDGDARAKR
jgi:hypothetical protein